MTLGTDDGLVVAAEESIARSLLDAAATLAIPANDVAGPQVCQFLFGEHLPSQTNEG